MGEEKQISVRFDGELLADHELINKIKDTLENVCEQLSTLSSEPLDDTLSHLDKDNKLPSILKLSCYIESWAINHTREERHRTEAQNNSNRENLNFPQEERNRQAEFVKKFDELRTKTKDLERILFENKIFRRLLRPNADGNILSVSIENLNLKSTQDIISLTTSLGNYNQASSSNRVPDHPVSLKGKEKEVTGSNSNELVQTTPASKSPKSSPSRGLLQTSDPGIVTFSSPVGSRPGNGSFCYRFSDCVIIKPNLLYPSHRNHVISDSFKTGFQYVRAYSSTTKKILVSLLPDTSLTNVQRLSPTELVYPHIEFQVPSSGDDLKGLLPIPLPVTLEELFHGTTKKLTFSKVEKVKDRNYHLSENVRSKIHLEVNIKAGMSAGQKIEINTPRGWPIRRWVFEIYQIEHPVFTRKDPSDNSANLQLQYRDTGGSSESKSLQITFIDGEQKLLNSDDFDRGTYGANIKKRGMPKNAVPNAPKGDLQISVPYLRKRLSMFDWDSDDFKV